MNRNTQKKPAHFHPYSQSVKQALDVDRKSGIPSWEQSTGSRAREVEAGPPTTDSDQSRVRVLLKDNYCVTQGSFVNVASKDCVVNRTGKKQTFVDSYQTCCQSCSFCRRVATKEMPKSQYCSTKVMCEKRFLCRLLEYFFQKCYKCPIVAPDL